VGEVMRAAEDRRSSACTVQNRGAFLLAKVASRSAYVDVCLREPQMACRRAALFRQFEKPFDVAGACRGPAHASCAESSIEASPDNGSPIGRRWRGDTLFAED